ncbi:Serine ase stubble [Brachionus plicatilis]|uniref:Serine ase stubble n=1 Tax=Brachionus plicatilis TaxID=10195 RepID=A0A3M7RBI5_BRAPC|nr:Serine ase stubble [Brachionus plicatilis]
MSYFQNIVVQLLFVDVNSLANLQRISKLNHSRPFLKFANQKTYTPMNSDIINPTECGRRIDEIKSRDLNKIVGGQVADPEDWGWQTALEHNGIFFCGGSLINSQWVLTAAHCFSSVGIQNPSRFVLRFGSHDRENPESYSTTRNVNKIIIHPNYNNINLDNDIALMNLSVKSIIQIDVFFIQTYCLKKTHNKFLTLRIKVIKNFLFVYWNIFVQFVFEIHKTSNCIPDQSQIFAGESSWATGWGSQVFSGYPTRYLLEVELPILSDSRCKEKYPRVNTQIALCAGEEGQNKDTCQGDSGGPLVVKYNNKWFLAGITSWGDGCGDGGVYARTSYYTNWILENIGSGQFSDTTKKLKRSFRYWTIDTCTTLFCAYIRHHLEYTAALTLIQMFKLTKSINKVSLVNPSVPESSLSQPEPAGGIRGHARRLYDQASTKCLERANTFTNRIVNEWNALPVTVTDAHSVNMFKNRYDAFRSSQQS